MFLVHARMYGLYSDLHGYYSAVNFNSVPFTPVTNNYYQHPHEEQQQQHSYNNHHYYNNP